LGTSQKIYKLTRVSKIKLVVGLGNPGQKYEGTRHNVGFMVIDELIRQSGISLSNHLRWRAHIGKLPNSGATVMKPQTFMNLSGQSVGAAIRYYKWAPEEVLVVYDDVSLPFAHLRFRKSGSSGGHNGIKSIISHLGTDQFPRLKIGIGEMIMDNDMADEVHSGVSVSQKNQKSRSTGLVGHVLGTFSQKERNELENTLARMAEAVQFALSDGVEAAANTFNTKKKRAKKQKKQTDKVHSDADVAPKFNDQSTTKPLT